MRRTVKTVIALPLVALAALLGPTVATHAQTLDLDGVRAGLPGDGHVHGRHLKLSSWGPTRISVIAMSW